MDARSMSPDKLSSVLQDYIKKGHALIILDSLDEIPISDQRSKLVNAVENFAETSVVSHIQHFGDATKSPIGDAASPAVDSTPTFGRCGHSPLEM